jgi:hypothetical protein
MTTGLYDIETERCILVDILSRNVKKLELALNAGLEANCFFDQKNRVIFRAALDLATKGESIDHFELKKQLEQKNQFDEVGIAYLISLYSEVLGHFDTAKHAAKLVTLARERNVISAAANLQTAANSGNGSMAAAVEDLRKAFHSYESPLRTVEHKFEQCAEDFYTLTFPEIKTRFEIDRLRREHGELIAELRVISSMPGIKTYDGILSAADFNLSSARARSERASLLSKKANVDKLDWPSYLEEACARILAAERNGQPAVDLRELERPGPDDVIRVAGLSLPRRHPTIFFGDGGAAKSYLALYIAGLLANLGLVIAFYDWELAGEDHRDRLERIFGHEMPRILYVRCERPLIYESDRLIRIGRDNRVDYAIYDSVAFACGGAPESAEIAGNYFRAVRQIGVGSLHIAHITKSEGGDQKPFGSVFFHNGARSTYYMQATESSTDGKTLAIGLFNRKSNLSRIQPPTGYTIQFGADQTVFEQSEPADNPMLAEKMTVRQRMRKLLYGGAMSIEEVAEQIEKDPDTIRRTAVRHKAEFKILNGGKVALLQRDTESGHFVRRTVNDRVSGE